MDQIEEVSPDFVPFKNEQCIQIRFRDGIRDGRVVLTNPVSFQNIKSVNDVFFSHFKCALLRTLKAHTANAGRYLKVLKFL